mgnify:FL=1
MRMVRTLVKLGQDLDLKKVKVSFKYAGSWYDVMSISNASLTYLQPGRGYTNTLFLENNLRIRGVSAKGSGKIVGSTSLLLETSR